ncbi:hypothetical protein [Acinetobacter haemolyticus]|uniref:hypothetical protein n=1 Tax=Acinetobacter haemolyticus TaxID=29430 RepID=UPI0030094EB7
MTSPRHKKEFTNKELDRIKEMYLAGDSIKDIASSVNRTRIATSAAIHRMLHSKQIPVLRSMAVIYLGGIDAAQIALEKSKARGSKTVRYLTKNCIYSNVPVGALEQQISRYKLASHLLGAKE